MARKSGEEESKRRLAVPARTKKVQTVRERAEGQKAGKSKRIRKHASKVAEPVKKVSGFGRRIGRFLVPNNRFGRILRKIGRILWPKYFTDAWHEIKLVTWPNRRETVRLTFAVFVFALVFGVTVAALDYGLDKLFREVIVEK